MKVSLRQFIIGNCLALLALALLVPSISATSSRTGTLLVLGDSIAAGYGVEIEEAFPALLEEKLKTEGHDFQVVNGGISGDTTASGLRRIDWMLRCSFDIVLIELGGNDGLRGLSPQQTKENLQGIIDKIRAKSPSTRIILAGMQMPANMGEEYTEEFKAVFPSLARQNDTYLIPFILEGVGGVAELNQPDRIHPTAEGHKIVAGNAWKVLEKVLGDLPSGEIAAGN